jgi:Holliday junction resolvase RusA-like endonuclease
VSIRATLPVPPSANRWWRNANGRMHTSHEARKYKATVAALVRSAPLAGEVVLTVAWYRARRSGDLDKRLGVLCDALQGIAYHTDAQIVAIHATRHDDPDRPRVEVTVRAADTTEVAA